LPVAVLVCRRFGHGNLSPFWCRRFGVSPFWFVAVLTIPRSDTWRGYFVRHDRIFQHVSVTCVVASSPSTISAFRCACSDWHDTVRQYGFWDIVSRRTLWSTFTKKSRSTMLGAETSSYGSTENQRLGRNDKFWMQFKPHNQECSWLTYV